ncbi:MAG TPA: response regulator [Chitinophagaceae bacterium]|nr:response regulator [Chitinophagaceae bacterium]
MKKILVADDDLDILTLVKMTLGLQGFSVDAISNWKEIDNHVNNFAPDLIILDVSLGGADGRDICKKLKQAPLTKHIPVILFSANVEMGESIQDCQAEAFIAKPYELSHFLTTIRSHLS